MSGENGNTATFDLWYDAAERVAADPVMVNVGARTHCGHVRANNEDHHVVLRRQRLQAVLATSLPDEFVRSLDETVYLMAVADGLGGEQHGELASRLVLESWAELEWQYQPWLTSLEKESYDEVYNRFCGYLETFKDVFRDFAEEFPHTASGTTWTCAYVMGRDVLVVHVGDSRAYVCRDGVLGRLTNDHTVEQVMLDRGIAPGEAARYRNVLSNSIGTNTTEINFDIEYARLEPGDSLLLCTDGLTDEVGDFVIAEELASGDPPQIIATRLVERALDKGGRDNVTAVVASIDEA